MPRKHPLERHPGQSVKMARRARGERTKTSPESAAPHPPQTPAHRPAARRGASIEIAGRTLNLSNLDKILYPTPGFSKGQVIDYYARIAGTILPYLKNRPLTLKRYPNGVDAEYFYEKMCPSHRPDWVSTTRVASTNDRKYIQYCLIDDAPTLVWVANLASLELHTLLSTADDIMRPTFMVFDHDPGEGADLLDCIRIALRFRELLKDLGLKSFPKTSGGKGLHLYIPLNNDQVHFEQTKNLSRAIAQVMEKDDPEHVTSNMRKDLRVGKVFVDWSQNDDHKTTVTAYSLRAREYPSVSMPVRWEELEEALKKKDPSRLIFRSDQALARVEKEGDPFAPVLKLKQQLPTL